MGTVPLEINLMRIVLLNPPYKNFSCTQPPLGLAYLASIAQGKGINAEIIDAHAENISEDEIVKRIYSFKPDALGVTATTPVFNAVVRILQEFKKISSVPVVMGGPHASALPEETLLAGGIDIVVRGEGEAAFGDLLDCLFQKNDLQGVAGISFLKNGRIFSTPQRVFINNLNNLAFPDWRGFSLGKYYSPARKKRLSLPIMTSRGCPFQCYFCYKGVFGSQYRFRALENVVDEIKHLREAYHIEEYSVIDDNFNLLPGRAEEFCRIAIREKLNLPWSLPNGIRANPLTKELLELLKASGCYRVSFGAESGDEKILRKINKGITLDEIKKAVCLAKEAGLETGVFFMFGNFGEDEETMERTIQFALDLEPDFAQFSIATPYPGTEFYELVNKEGRFLFKTWEELGSYEKAVFECGSLSANIINKKFKEAYRRFYLRPKYIFKKFAHIKTARDANNLLNGLKIFFDIIMKKGR